MHRQLGHFERTDSVALTIRDGGVDDYGETIMSTRDGEKNIWTRLQEPQADLVVFRVLSLGHPRP